MIRCFLLSLTLLTLHCRHIPGNKEAMAASIPEPGQEELLYQMTYDSTMHDDERPQAAPSEPEEPLYTRLKYPYFTLIFYNFKGYEVREYDEKKYISLMDTSEAELYYEKTDGKTLEYLKVKKDTLRLDESLAYSGSVNLILIKSVLRPGVDSFVMSYALLNGVSELFHHFKMSENEREKLYESAFHAEGITTYKRMRDSAGRYFRMPPRPAYEDQANYVNGYMPKKDFASELQKIKDKYHMRDTFLQFSSEGGAYYALLTKDGRLFSYDNEAYIFKVQRFRNGKYVETKYVVVYIASGC